MLQKGVAPDQIWGTQKGKKLKELLRTPSSVSDRCRGEVNEILGESTPQEVCPSRPEEAR